MSRSFSVLTSTDCKDRASLVGCPLSLPMEDSSLGDSNQETHTMRNRLTRNHMALCQKTDEIDESCQTLEWKEIVTVPRQLPFGVEYSTPDLKRYKFYYKHDLFPIRLNGERIPIPQASTITTSYRIDASKALSLYDPLDCQSGVLELLCSKGDDIPDCVMSWVEDITALYGALRDCSTTTQFVSICVMFIKQHLRGSITRHAVGYLQEIFSDLIPQDSEGANDPEWLEFFRSLKQKWESSLTSPMFSKLSRLISLAVSIGLCQLSDIAFNIAGVKLFSLNLKEKHATAKDFLDCLLDTVSFFLEGGYQCFKQRSLKPLLLGDTALANYEANYYKCIEFADLVKAGNLEKFEGLTENDFEKLLTDTIESCEGYCQAAQFGTEKSILLRQKEKLLLAHSQFRQCRLQGGLRVAPYAIGVFGPSGVGKSTIAQLLMTCALEANDYCADDDRVVTLNEGDKFMSNYKAYVNGIYIDDLGNTKSDFVERSPAQKIIEIVNNVHAYATVAEAELKGKIAIEPKVVLITRNVKEKFAHDYSNEPASILRREKITLTITVRDHFATDGMLDQDKVVNYYDGNVPIIPDLWVIDVERAYPIKNTVKGKHDNVGFKYVELDGIALKQCSIFDVIRYVKSDSQKHFIHQENLVSRSKNIAGQIAVCKKCKLPKQMCYCPPVDLEPHFGFSDAGRYCVSCADDVGAGIASAYSQLREFDTKWLRLINFVPSWMIKSALGKSFMWWYTVPLCKQRFDLLIRKYSFALGASVVASICVSKYCLLITLAILIKIVKTVLSYREFLINKVMESRDSVPALFKDLRENSRKYLVRSCIAISGVYAALRVYRFMTRIKPHGNLSPRTMADIAERDAEANPWSDLEITPLKTTPYSQCITHDHLTNLVSKNLCFMSFEHEKKIVYSNAFFPCSNVVLIPKHMWKKDELTVTFHRKGSDVIGGSFTAYLSRAFSVDLPNADLSLVWVANGGSWKDLTQYLPLGDAVRAPCTMVYKTVKGSVLFSKTLVKPGMVHASHMSYYGLHYVLDKPTFNGLCMAPLVSETRAPSIMGFHLAGRTGTTTGAGASVSQQSVTAALAALRSKPGILLSTSVGNIPTERYDCQFFEGDHLHAHSPVRYLPKGANIECYGSVAGRAKHFSEVVQTPISEIVADVCDVPNQWGKPKFHLGTAWQVSLAHSCKPSPGMPGNLLSVAVQDYLNGFVSKLQEFPVLLQSTRPLNKVQTVCGIDGKRFIDKMPSRTSMGYPLGGPKSEHLKALSPDEHPEFACPMEIDERFWDEAMKMETLVLSNTRAYPIFKGCLKDEPTSLSKDKVRVFQSAPIELQLLIRKYYLPVARLLSIFPLDSECAVGINAQGPEWETFSNHITKFGKDRIFAGDYSKYDLRMPSQLVLSAFRILVDIARKCNYGERDLRVMEGLASEIAYPLMAYNGDLIQLFGSNPSGQNLTVFINGLVNSLLVRCYLAQKNIIPKVAARDVISFLTYGDDIKGSVHPNYSVSIKEYASFLSHYDMVFTMPDKDSELVDLMTDKDADFLKRQNVFVPKLGMHLGALDEKSIFKSLHTVLRSSAVSLKEQSMMNIDGALREWFAHGETVYEKRRSQMQCVAERAGISHGCPGLQMTFDDRIQAFWARYGHYPGKDDVQQLESV